MIDSIFFAFKGIFKSKNQGAAGSFFCGGSKTKILDTQKSYDFERLKKTSSHTKKSIQLRISKPKGRLWILFFYKGPELLF